MKKQAFRVMEAARRVYGELVVGRTRVRVVPVSQLTGGATPRFVLGPYRSGTTLLRYCLDSHPSLAAPPETDFIAHLIDMLADPDSIRGFEGLGFDRSHAIGQTSRFARSFFEAYAQSQDKEHWIDKSPRYAERPEELLELFPDGKFVLIHRHPLDQIHSITKGGNSYPPAVGSANEPGAKAIEDAAKYWTEVTSALISFEEDNPDSVLSITYDGLCALPEETLRRVISFLELEWSPSVLDYHKFDHDLGKEAGRIRGTVGFSKSEQGWRKWPSEWTVLAWDRVAEVAESRGFAAP